MTSVPTLAARYDAVVVGGGHNGLTAAAYLGRAGRTVLVLERLDHVGGAAVSARVFPGVDARLSRYSYLVSLLPGRVIEELRLPLQLARRRYSSYTPVGDAGLLVDTGDDAATRASFEALGADADHVAWARWYAATGRLARRLFPGLGACPQAGFSTEARSAGWTARSARDGQTHERGRTPSRDPAHHRDPRRDERARLPAA
jgi:phytoene dehydrogenase-like protein